LLLTRSVSDIKPVDWLKIGILAVLLGGLYYSTLYWLVTKDWPRDDYNHSYLVPLVVLYLLWDNRQRILETPVNPAWSGLLPFVFGLCLFWLGELAGEFFSIYLSLWLIIVGLCVLLSGWGRTLKMGFPLFMILTMFPLPHFLYNKVSVQLKLISSKIGVAMIQAYGMSAFREGNIIDLGFTQLQVVDACSGLRFLIPMIVLGIVLAYFFRASWWKRIILVVSTVPLSIITNSLRIALTGILYEIWGAEVAEGFFHGFSGWFIFMFTLVVLLLEMWILKWLPPRTRPVSKTAPTETETADEASESAEDTQIDEEAQDVPEKASSAGDAWYRPTQFILVVVILVITLGLAQGIEFREETPPSQAFSQWPVDLGEWQGKRQVMEERFIVELDLSDYVIIDYKNPKGQTVNFYTAYYQSQSKGESIHSPATCLPGSGWLFTEAGNYTIKTPGMEKDSFQVRRAFMQKGPYKQLVYYWFPQRGRDLVSAYQLKLYAFWDALTKQRTDGALVRVITPVYEGEEIKLADQRLTEFTQEMLPVLNRFIPGERVP
jgi:exosortase D (VPLPA-CTERM-specific)